MFSFFSVNFFSSAQYVQNAILERIIYTRIKIITRRMRARYRPICGLKVNQTHTRCSDFSFVDIAIHNSIASSLQKSYVASRWRRQRRRRWKYKHEHKATCSDMANINTQQTCRKWTQKKQLNWLSGQLWSFCLRSVWRERERKRLAGRKALNFQRLYDYTLSRLPSFFPFFSSNSKLYYV